MFYRAAQSRTWFEGTRLPVVKLFISKNIFAAILFRNYFLHIFSFFADVVFSELTLQPRQSILIDLMDWLMLDWSMGCENIGGLIKPYLYLIIFVYTQHIPSFFGWCNKQYPTLLLLLKLLLIFQVVLWLYLNTFKFYILQFVVWKGHTVLDNMIALPSFNCS